MNELPPPTSGPIASPAPTSPSAPRRAGDRRPDGPRRVRHGLKLAGRNESPAFTGIGLRWMKLLESAIDPAALAAGLEYARVGQTVSLDLRAGSLEANVQGTAARPYAVRIGWTPFSAEQWEQVVQAMARESIHLAKLLAGELPSNLDSVLDEFGLTLVPDSAHRLSFGCSCSEPHPCKHHGAIAYLSAERLTTSPLTIFMMLGLPVDQLLDRVRRARTIQERGVATVHADASIPETQLEPIPLEACIDDFWRAGPHLEEIQSRPPRQHVSHALLRRLGPSPLSGKFPMVGLLASVYDTVASAALRVRDGGATADAADELE